MQIVIRIIGAGIPVFDFVAGEIVEGQFKPFSSSDLRDRVMNFSPALEKLVSFSDLIGTQAYLKSSSLGAATALITTHPRFAGMLFCSNFIVFDLSDLENHVETKKKDA